MVFSGKPLAVYDRHHLPTPRMKRIENARLKRRTPGIVTLDRPALARGIWRSGLGWLPARKA
jgi:hypothetical protein